VSIRTEGMSNGGGAWVSLGRAARLEPGERSRFWLSVALALGAVLAAAGLLTASGYLISRAAQRPDILRLAALIVAVRAFGLSRAVLRYSERLASHDLALRVLARLRSRFYEVLAPLIPGAITGHTRGELLSRFVGDVDALQDLYLRALAPPLVAALVIIAAGFTAWLILPLAAVAVAGSLILAAVSVPLLAGVLAGRAGRRQAPARAALTAALVEAVDGGPELAVAGRGPDWVKALGARSDALSVIAAQDALAGAGATLLGSLVSGLAIVAVLVVGIPAVHSGALAGVWLAALVFLVMGAFEGVAPLPAAAQRLRACAQAAMRLQELEATEPVVRDPVAPLAATPELLDGPLVLEGVSFGYDTAGPVLLDAVDIRLDRGCRVLFSGPSGAGKTTLAYLLVRFLDPDAGRVTLGGVDLRELAQDDVRRAVLLAAQDAHVFATTIRENLLLARRSASEPELWDALGVVQLEDWARSLPDALDTLVGENGELVSGGQRHRLTLARALLSDANFLILDEPTAHLDADTATSLIEAICEAADDRGLLVISHRDEGFDGFYRLHLDADGRLAPQELTSPIGRG